MHKHFAYAAHCVFLSDFVSNKRINHISNASERAEMRLRSFVRICRPGKSAPRIRDLR